MDEQKVQQQSAQSSGEAAAQSPEGEGTVSNTAEGTTGEEKQPLAAPETAAPEHQLPSGTEEEAAPLPTPETAAPEHQLEAPATAAPEHQLSPAEESAAEAALPAEAPEDAESVQAEGVPQEEQLLEGEETGVDTTPASSAEDASAEAEAAVTSEETAGSEEGATTDEPAETLQSVAETAAEAPAEEEEEHDEVFAELLQAKAQDTPIEVTGLRRVRNGILVQYKDRQLFLPVQLISEKPNPPENEILSFIKKKFLVHVHRIFPDDRRRIVVTRKEIIRQERLAQLQEGEIVEGRVSGFTSYGAFVDLGGVEGMVHVSNLSPRPVRHPEDVLTRNEKVKVRILSIDRETGRIALSMKEFMRERERERLEKIWPEIVQEFPPGTRLVGTVRRIWSGKGQGRRARDIGVWVELKPGVEGWLPIGELSWARRLQHPGEMVKVGDQLEVEVIELDEQRKRIILSHRRTQPNTWETIEERFPIGMRLEGTVTHILEKGVVVNLAEDVDAFLPRGKMLPELRRQEKPFAIGAKVEVLVMDVEPEQHSLIVGMEGFDRPMRSSRPSPGRRGGGKRPSEPREKTGRVRLMDLLSEEERRKLFGEAEAPPAQPESSAPSSAQPQESEEQQENTEGEAPASPE